MYKLTKLEGLVNPNLRGGGEGGGVILPPLLVFP